MSTWGEEARGAAEAEVAAAAGPAGVAAAGSALASGWLGFVGSVTSGSFAVEAGEACEGEATGGAALDGAVTGAARIGRKESDETITSREARRAAASLSPLSVAASSAPRKSR